MLAGNKVDREENREVSREAANAFAVDKNMPFYEISALTGENV